VRRKRGKGDEKRKEKIEDPSFAARSFAAVCCTPANFGEVGFQKSRQTPTDATHVHFFILKRADNDDFSALLFYYHRPYSYIIQQS